MNPETKQIQGAIENWHDMHNKENRGWANELAKKHYEQFQSELAASQAQQGTGSSSGGSVNEQEIFNKVFGEHRGRNIGMGRKIKKKSSVSSSSTRRTPSTVEMENMIRFAHESLVSHQQEQERKRYHDMAAWFASFIPNANLENLPPFVATPAPPFDYNAYKERFGSQQQEQSRDIDDIDDEEQSSEYN